MNCNLVHGNPWYRTTASSKFHAYIHDLDFLASLSSMVTRGQGVIFVRVHLVSRHHGYATDAGLEVAFIIIAIDQRAHQPSDQALEHPACPWNLAVLGNA